ncbi:NucA/NucB deoxyribonuclease domain-containing protein [Streptomyces sp. NBC_00690]|uniref:NucA/NucB deoxyribonuclease domain-containing protein n=1 Tax=Streptomyces sp. NBC_00690 TaxID=2975808 RepID=UPI002E27D2FD|nr:hypothetical protein [Streptomyces sp. NBC_00690]
MAVALAVLPAQALASSDPLLAVQKQTSTEDPEQQEIETLIALVAAGGAREGEEPLAQEQAQLSLQLPQSCAIEGAYEACVQLEPATPASSSRFTDAPSPQAGIKPPKWCADSNGRVLGIRTQTCVAYQLSYKTWQVIGGQRRQTGEALGNLYSFGYSDTSVPTWGQQIEVGMYAGWGDAIKGSVRGTSTGQGKCTRTSVSFPGKPFLPLNTWRLGESFYRSTATAAGAVGTCATTWALTFTAPGCPGSALPHTDREFRCDNNTAGRPQAGCVVPWYASHLNYSTAKYPALASHVSRAQASGLPGGRSSRPLHRTTDPVIQNDNRRLACGDAASITGKSCDEYPVATSREGLSAGGTRRTFDNCDFNLPRETGPRGASACMIAVGDNNAQGGLNTQFYRANRVLDGDPFHIVVTP